MRMLKVHAEGGSGGQRGGRMVSTPRSGPTSVQGRFMAQNGTRLGQTGRGGRPARATYVPPRATRGTR